MSDDQVREVESRRAGAPREGHRATRIAQGVSRFAGVERRLRRAMQLNGAIQWSRLMLVMHHHPKPGGGMKIKTGVKSGKISANHNQALR